MRDNRVNNGRFRFTPTEDNVEEFLDRCDDKIKRMDGYFAGFAVGAFAAITTIACDKQKVYYTPEIHYKSCCKNLEFDIPSQRIDLNGDWKWVKRSAFVGASALTTGIVGQMVQNVGTRVNNNCKERQRRRWEARRNQDIENNSRI
jgi:hypothetical protein